VAVSFPEKLLLSYFNGFKNGEIFALKIFSRGLSPCPDVVNRYPNHAKIEDAADPRRPYMTL